MDDKLHNDLFSTGQEPPLSLEQIRAYQRGELSDLEKHHLELRLLDDELDAEAMEGLMDAGPDDEILNSVEELKGRAWNRVAELENKRRRGAWRWVAAAASIAILVSVSFLVMRNQENKQMEKLFSDNFSPPPAPEDRGGKTGAGETEEARKNRSLDNRKNTQSSSGMKVEILDKNETPLKLDGLEGSKSALKRSEPKPTEEQNSIEEESVESHTYSFTIPEKETEKGDLSGTLDEKPGPAFANRRQTNEKPPGTIYNGGADFKANTPTNNTANATRSPNDVSNSRPFADANKKSNSNVEGSVSADEPVTSTITDIELSAKQSTETVVSADKALDQDDNLQKDRLTLLEEDDFEDMDGDDAGYRKDDGFSADEEASLVDEGEYDDFFNGKIAMEDAVEELKKSENARDNRTNAASIRQKSKQDTPAINAYKYQSSYGNSLVNFSTALQAYEARNFEQAAVAFDQLIDQDPQNLQANFYAGVSYLSLDMPRTALDRLNPVLKDPENSLYEDALWYGALANIKLKEKKEAKQLLESVKARKGKYYERANRTLRDLKD